MKDSFAFGLRHGVGPGAQPDVRAGGARAAAPADPVGAQVSYEDPDYIAGDGVRPPGLRLPSRTAGRTRARRSRSRASRATISSRSTRRWFGANNAILAIVGDVTHEEAFAGAERAFGTWGRAEATAAEAGRAAAADPARRRHRSARRGADRDPRRQHRPAAQAQGLPGARPGDQDPRRRRRQPAAPRAAHGSRADLRRVGRRQRAQGRGQHRRRHQHAVRGDGRSAAADRGRVLAAPARARAGSASWPTRRRT